MKSRALVCALVALSLSGGQFAFAQDGGDRTGHDRADQAQRNNDRDSRRNEAQPTYRPQRGDRGRGEERRRDDRQPRNEWNQDRGARYERGGERGAGPDHAFHRGDRLPREYRSNSYVVDDWRGHHLSAPPRGYHWVQTGGDYVLVAITTGIILQLLLSN